MGLALCASHNETGIEDGDEGNIPSPASPGGTPFGMLSLPRGSKFSHPLPLIDEIPTGDSGPVSISSAELAVAGGFAVSRTRVGGLQATTGLRQRVCP